MGKRNRGFTRQKYEKWLKEGRGKGEGKGYKAWLTIQDVPSTGREHRLHGNKTGRQHDLLSDNERDVFYIYNHADSVIDIKEQYPLLPIEETEKIAAEISVKHPTDLKTGEHTVLTTDFLISLIEKGEEKNIARTVKSFEDLNDKRQIEKFEIERRYWKDRGVDWGIIVDKDINRTLASNIDNIYHAFELSDVDGFEKISEAQLTKMISAFKSIISGQDIVVRERASKFEEKMILKPGTGIILFKHLLVTKQIKIDSFFNTGLNILIDTPQNISILIKNENRIG